MQAFTFRTELLPGKRYPVRMPHNLGAAMLGVAGKIVGVEVQPENDDFFASVTIHHGGRVIRYYGIATAGLTIEDGKVYGTVETTAVRFWNWHTEGFVKFTVRPSKPVEITTGGAHEEGYSVSHDVFYFADGKLGSSHETNGRDCDGPHSSWSEHECDFNDIDANEHTPMIELAYPPSDKTPMRLAGYQVVENAFVRSIRTPLWNKCRAGQYDAYAEAMGY